jgi:glycosyltransferase involved in cell wall biosynthesis
LYNEEESIRELLKRIFLSCKNIETEIIFVDDGSTDNSLGIIKELAGKNENVNFISFRKNMGKASALMAGFKNCHGDIVVTMDADLQDDPAEIPRFIEKIEEGYDVVSGWKYQRQDPLEKRLPSKFFNKTVSVLSGIKLHDFNCGFKAYRREVTDTINLYGEQHRFIPVLAYRYGFSVGEIKVHHNKREHGKSKYGIKRYLRGLYDAITVSFMNYYALRPMHFFGAWGLFLILCGLSICVYLIITKFAGQSIGDRPILLLGVLLLIVGVQSFSLGLIGEMFVDINTRGSYSEAHFKDKIIRHEISMKENMKKIS